MDTNEDKAIRAIISSNRATSSRNKIDEVAGKDESSTISNIAALMFDRTEERIKTINR